MTTTLSRHEQQIAARYGGAMVCLVARCVFDLAHIKSSVYGASDFIVDGQRYWMQTTNKGIELRRQLGEAPEHVLSWNRVVRHVDALPAPLRARAARVDRLAHTTFPFQPWHPATSSAERIAEADRLRDWSRERFHRVAHLRGAVLEASFPLAHDHEPVDLFDLIEAG